MGDVRHAAPVEGVGVGMGCLASPVVSRFVVLARVSGYSRRLALVTRVIPLSLHSYFPPTMRSTVAVPTSIALFRPPPRARFPRSTYSPLRCTRGRRRCISSYPRTGPSVAFRLPLL